MQFLINIYRHIFCHPFFYKLNIHLYKFALRGIGVLNSEGNFWTGENNFLKKLAQIEKIQTIFDVGSNTDAYGYEYFKKAQIYTFEPHPDTFQKFKKKWRSKTRVKGFNLAVSNKVGHSKLWDFADDAELKKTQPTSQLSTLYKPIMKYIHKQKAQAFDVKTTTIDSFMKQQKIEQIDLLKIDAEGHEYQVLQGAKKAIKQKKIKIVQFEFNEMNVFSKKFLIDFIKILPKYKFYRLMPYGLMPLANYRPVTHEIFGFQNIVAWTE
jgi:FkbM family methyltransferase